MTGTKTKRAFTLYFVFIVLSVFLSNITGRGSAVMYGGYFASILFLLFSFTSRVNRLDLNVFLIGVLITISSFFTFVTHSEHAFDSIRSGALNINIITPFIYFFVIGILKTQKISQKTVEDILYNYLIITLVVGVTTLIININSIGRIFSLSTSAYNVALKGFFPNKNMFGNFTSIGAVIGIHLYASKKNRVNLVAMLMLVFLTIISFCRAALLFLGTFSFVYLFSSSFIESNKEKRRVRIIRWIMIAALVLFIITLIYIPKFNSFVLNKILRTDVSDVGRSSVHNKALLLLKNGSVFEYLFGYGPSELEYQIPMDVHSTYYNLLLTGGIIKLALFVHGLFISLRCIIRFRRSLISCYCLSCMISYIVFSAFETVVYFELGFLSFEVLFNTMIIPLTLNTDSISDNSPV